MPKIPIYFIVPVPMINIEYTYAIYYIIVKIDRIKLFSYCKRFSYIITVLPLLCFYVCVLGPFDLTEISKKYRLNHPIIHK